MTRPDLPSQRSLVGLALAVVVLGVVLVLAGIGAEERFVRVLLPIAGACIALGGLGSLVLWTVKYDDVRRRFAEQQDDPPVPVRRFLDSRVWDAVTIVLLVINLVVIVVRLVVEGELSGGTIVVSLILIASLLVRRRLRD